MAERGGGESKRFKEHPIIERLRAEPGKEAEQTVRLMGYVGRSGKEGSIRLYPTLDDLSQYIEIREEDVLHSEDVPDTIMEHGASSLWVKASAELLHRQTQTQTVQAQFLGGGIAQENLRDQVTSPVGQIQLIPTIYQVTCRYVTCFNTCMLRTCYGTCHFTCFATCNITCARTCRLQLTCGRTCLQLTCYRTCALICKRTIINPTCYCEFDPFDRFADPFGGGDPSGGDPFGGGGGPFGGGGGPFGGGFGGGGLGGM
jgi:hypothetical protein